MYFLFNNAPNVLYRGKICTTGRPIQHLDSSTTKPCCCNSYSMWFCFVLLKYTSSGGEHMLLLNRYLSFSIHSAFQNMQAAHTVSSLARRTRRMWFPTRMSNLDTSDHRTLFHFENICQYFLDTCLSLIIGRVLLHLTQWCSDQIHPRSKVELKDNSWQVNAKWKRSK